MDKKSSKRKMLRRNYKRYAAAVAGAAILAGAGLPGMSDATASAAPIATGSSSKTVVVQDNHKPVKVAKGETSNKKVFTNKKTTSNNNKRPGYGWHQHNNSWPSSSDNHGWYQDGKIYYSNGSHYNNHYRYYDYDRYDGRASSRYLYAPPVDFAKSQAARYGFDRARDSFSLVSQRTNSATVLIKKANTGKQYIMDLERDTSRSNWHVVAVQGITR